MNCETSVGIVGKLVNFKSQCLLYKYVNVIVSLSELDEGLRWFLYRATSRTTSAPLWRGNGQRVRIACVLLSEATRTVWVVQATSDSRLHFVGWLPGYTWHSI